MKTNCQRRLLRAAIGLLALLAGVTILSPGVSAQTAPRRTQTLQLQRGWNAVYLEVIPTNPAPASVFAGAPVNIVATFLGTVTTVQFIRDPAAIGWKKEGWAVWYAPHRPDSFLSTLHDVGGQCAYLIEAERDFTWNIEGYVELSRVVWKADAFNFIGFSLDPQSPPTFEKFFGGSKAHRSSRIFRLVDGHWSLVTNPIGTEMRAGEAFWVECLGGSDYQGPLRIKSPDGHRLSFGDRTKSHLLVANESRDPATVRVETIGVEPGVPMAYTVSTITDAGPQDVDTILPAVHPFGTLEPSARMSLRLKARRDQMTSPAGATLLKISNGAGAMVWVPVTAQRGDLSATSQ
jgi:hypothetical protein